MRNGKRIAQNDNRFAHDQIQNDKQSSAESTKIDSHSRHKCQHAIRFIRNIYLFTQFRIEFVFYLDTIHNFSPELETHLTINFDSI